MNFCLQIINYSGRLLITVMWLFTVWEGEHTIFPDVHSKNGDKYKAFGTFSGEWLFQAKYKRKTNAIIGAVFMKPKHNCVPGSWGWFFMCNWLCITGLQESVSIRSALGAGVIVPIQGHHAAPTGTSTVSKSNLPLEKQSSSFHGADCLQLHLEAFNRVTAWSWLISRGTNEPALPEASPALSDS